jgi:circadian clock protein KaiC
MVERIPSGIRGFDDLIDGGFPEGNLVLLLGAPGTGKTIFCGKFIYEGLERGEKCLYVTFTEPKEKIFDIFSNFDWDFYTYEKRKFLRIIDSSIGEEREIEDTTSEIMDEARKIKAKRLVIDSLSAMLLGVTKDAKRRDFIRILYRVIYKLNITTLCIAELPVGEERIGYGMEEFVADGLIFLQSEYTKEEMARKLRIIKMRGTDHTKRIQRYTITNEGFELFGYTR